MTRDCGRAATFLILRPVLIMVILSSISAGFALAGLSAGDIATLREQGQKEGWTFTVGENDATQYSLDELCGLKVPVDWQKNADFDPCVSKANLPEAFDWRTLDGCPPIRNQRNCGSCWAFGTIGAIECNIKIKDSLTVDLSEQWLVSCNVEGWGCSGGWWAHQYFCWQGDMCGEAGAVMEADYPYAAANLTCNCPYPHSYRIASSAYIGNAYGVPDIDAMKQAIIDHGPISAAVASSDAMHAYTGGVFNYYASGEINHGVVLVGWDDNQGKQGVWIMRNSWGSGWGEGGYMRMEYGASRIGYGAAYVNYPGAVRITTTSLPSCSVGVAYSAQLEISAGGSSIVWTDRDGSLAGAGLSLSTGGLISGTPTVAGMISFVAEVHDNLGTHDEQAYTIEASKYIDGDANADTEVNIADAVYVLNYIFRRGQPPQPTEAAGDANCDGAANVGDVVFVITYVFNGGQGPACP